MDSGHQVSRSAVSAKAETHVIRSPVEPFHRCPRRRAALDTPHRANDGAFAETAFRKNSANAAYGAIMPNADVVKDGSGCRKLPVLRRKLLDSGRILSSKNTVKYNLRFFVNGENGAFCWKAPSAARNFIVRFP